MLMLRHEYRVDMAHSILLLHDMTSLSFGFKIVNLLKLKIIQEKSSGMDDIGEDPYRELVQSQCIQATLAEDVPQMRHCD